MGRHRQRRRNSDCIKPVGGISECGAASDRRIERIALADAKFRQTVEHCCDLCRDSTGCALELPGPGDGCLLALFAATAESSSKDLAIPVVEAVDEEHYDEDVLTEKLKEKAQGFDRIPTVEEIQAVENMVSKSGLRKLCSSLDLASGGSIHALKTRFKEAAYQRIAALDGADLTDWLQGPDGLVDMDKAVLRNEAWSYAKGHLKSAEALQGEHVVGFVALRWLGGGVHIAALAVNEANRRLGHGEALILRALSEAEDRGCTRASLHVREDNSPARALYEKHGFHLERVVSDYYDDGESALRMTRAL